MVPADPDDASADSDVVLNPDEVKIEQDEVDSVEDRFKGIDPWEKIGFIRPLGGFFYNYMLSLATLVIGFIMVGYLLGLFYPYPEAEGYRSVIGTIFALLFQIFDIGTAYGIERFIAEWRVKNPKKMLHYIQFFVWYQMFTGLIQTTAIAVWALVYIPQTNLAYGTWLFLLISTTQYPGMLGYFKAALKGFQHLHKTALLDFIGGQVFQNATNVIFILLGRYYGAKNPAVGELMGLAMGAAIGSYVDDFFSMWLSMHYFRKAVEPFGFNVRDCFGHDFDRALVKQCLSFGAQVSAGPLWGTFVGWVINLYWIYLVPQWTTWIQLSSVASGLASIVTFGSGIQLTSATSESFLNGKKMLAQFYIAQTWKYYTMFAFPILVVIGVFLPVILEVMLSIQGAGNYLLALPFLIPWIVRHMQQPPTSTADMILVGASKPGVLSVIRFVEETLKLLLMTTFIVWLELPNRYGFAAIVWLVPCGIYPAILFKTIYLWFYIHRNIVPVHIPVWQTFVAPTLASACMIGVSYLYLGLAWLPLSAAMGVVAAGGFSIVFALTVLLGIYFFFYSFFGGWDEFGLRTFRQAKEMSGPSKPLIGLIGAFLEAGVRISPLHDKYPIPSEDARREALELMIAREEVDKIVLDKGNEET
ncbi:MAG: hypothetical protein ACTSU5_02275 [Promethearchaeota archaeon]